MSSILKVDQIQNAAGTAGLTIDSNGVVSKSVVLAWRVGLSSDDLRTITTKATVPWDKTDIENCFLSGGVTISSGVITVPKSGLYQINANLRVDGVGSGYVIAKIVINSNDSGSRETYIIEGSPPSNYTTINGHDVFELAASDTVHVEVSTSADTSWDIQQNSSFSGVMIG